MNNSATQSKNNSKTGEKMKTPTSPRINSKDFFKELDDKLEMLAERLDSPETENEIKEFLKFQSKFYNYSFNNQFILYMQAVQRKIQIEQVASFDFWKKQKNDKGEKVSVKRGSKGLKVFVPIEYILYEQDNKGNFILNDKNKKTPKLDDNGNVIKKLGFKLGNVFDVNQTTAKTIGVYKELEYRNSIIKISDNVYYELKSSIEKSFQINITEKIMIDSACGGYCKYSSNSIVINSNPERTVAMKISTLFHELGHSLMHSNLVLNGKVNENELHRGMREGQAEAFSYVLSSFIGVENKSELYIKTWGNDKDSLKECISTISKAVKTAFNKLSLDKIYISTENKQKAA
jgi:hypothetical protein